MDEQFHNKDFQKLLDQRAKESLKRKAEEKARNEYNYQIYVRKREKAERKAKRKYSIKLYRKQIIYAIIIIFICILLSLEQQGVHIMDIIKTIMPK